MSLHTRSHVANWTRDWETTWFAPSALSLPPTSSGLWAPGCSGQSPSRRPDSGSASSSDLPRRHTPRFPAGAHCYHLLGLPQWVRPQHQPLLPVSLSLGPRGSLASPTDPGPDSVTPAHSRVPSSCLSLRLRPVLCWRSLLSSVSGSSVFLDLCCPWLPSATQSVTWTEAQPPGGSSHTRMPTCAALMKEPTQGSVTILPIRDQLAKGLCGGDAGCRRVVREAGLFPTTGTNSMPLSKGEFYSIIKEFT